MEAQYIYISFLIMIPIIGLASVLFHRGYFSYFLFANICINFTTALYFEYTKVALNINTFLYYCLLTVVFILLDYFYERTKERKMLRALEDNFKKINDKKHKKGKKRWN